MRLQKKICKFSTKDQGLSMEEVTAQGERKGRTWEKFLVLNFCFGGNEINKGLNEF